VPNLIQFGSSAVSSAVLSISIPTQFKSSSAVLHSGPPATTIALQMDHLDMVPNSIQFGSSSAVLSISISTQFKSSSAVLHPGPAAIIIASEMDHLDVVPDFSRSPVIKSIQLDQS